MFLLVLFFLLISFWNLLFSIWNLFSLFRICFFFRIFFLLQVLSSSFFEFFSFGVYFNLFYFWICFLFFFFSFAFCSLCAFKHVMYFQSRSSDFSIGSSAWKISEWYVFFCSVFYCIQSKCRKILNRKNSEFGHIGPYFEVEEEKAMPSLQFFFNPLHTQQIPIKDFFSKSDQIRRNLQIWSHLLKKSLLKNFIFCEVIFLKFWHSGHSISTQFYLKNAGK